MSKDVKCPYCQEPQKINHDDGRGYSEDDRHEQECADCGKVFTFTTTIVMYYQARKADCLNDSEHKLSMSSTYPRKFSRMQCEDCDYERTPTPEEFAAAGIDMTPDQS